MIVLITVALTVVNVIPVIREKQGKSGAALGKRGIAVCMAVVVAITGVGIAMLRKGGGASPQDAIAKYLKAVYPRGIHERGADSKL